MNYITTMALHVPYNSLQAAKSHVLAENIVYQPFNKTKVKQQFMLNSWSDMSSCSCGDSNNEDTDIAILE